MTAFSIADCWMQRISYRSGLTAVRRGVVRGCTASTSVLLGMVVEISSMRS